MSKDLLIDWLKTQQPNLEVVLLNSAEKFVEDYQSKDYFPYDARKTGEELWLLNKGNDLCYDRPTIGLNYALWYHPKRINTFLKYFTDLIYESRYETSVDIFDLGAGTGAVLWAVGIVCAGLNELNLPCPKIRVVNIDTSPFMLQYNYSYLWKYFIQKYPSASSISSESDYKLNSWTNTGFETGGNVWLCASYLFDHTDNIDVIINDFKSLTEVYKPNKILMLSSLTKKAYCDKTSLRIQELGFSEINNTLSKQVFNGPLTQLYNFRNSISASYDLNLTGIPKWDIDSLYGIILTNNRPSLPLNFEKINLFIKPEKDRTKINLTKEQTDSTKLSKSPTLIVGPAGCGKSVVLTQKIINILEETKIHGKYDPDVKILLTTFNKGLVRYLGDWIEQLLPADTFQRYFPGATADYSTFKFNDSIANNIYVMHFDILPTKLGKIDLLGISKGSDDIESFHFDFMKSVVEKFVLSRGIDHKKNKKILDPDFLLDEYHRVVYGSLCNSYYSAKHNVTNYSTISREGRGKNPQLKFKSEKRKIVWDIINSYLRELKNQNLESFIIRRHKYLKRLNNNGVSNKQFDFILVDEFQDCTKSDYEIFYNLLKDSNNLTLAGDLAQSIHLGASLHIPKADDQKRFTKKRLVGSFRLPFRVSECIKPLSQKINQDFGTREGMEVDVITPYKGAPPGTRPIFIYALDTNSAAEKIKSVFLAYEKRLKLDKISIYERDYELRNRLGQIGINSETEIILRSKGLEKSCVLWSTRIGLDTNLEIKEFVYTILTRTVSLLIVVVFPETRSEHIEIIRTFDKNRLIHWDLESERKYLELMSSTSSLHVEEDEQDYTQEISSYDDDESDHIIS